MKKINSSLVLLFTLCVGIAFSSCVKEEKSGSKASSSPKVDKLDPGSAKGSEVLTVTGSGLGDIVKIVFDKGGVPASFNPVLNTDNAVIFRVPDTANGGQQNIILTNRLGVDITVPFNVIALPLVTDVSNYNFTEGTQITLTGNNLGDVTDVTLTGTTAKATIVSKTKKSLVVSMPSSTVNRAFLDVKNSTGTITTTQEFVNIDNAYKIFTEGYGDHWESGSWGPASISTTTAKSGTMSFKATYAKGNWWANGFANWYPSFDFSADYKFLTFWVKGASIDYTLYITGDQRAGGYGNSDQTMPIVVPANVWTYFKIPLSTLDFWHKGTTAKQLGWWIKGPDTQDESFYFDDVLFVK